MKDNMKRAPFSTQIDLSKFDMKDFAKASDEEKRQQEAPCVKKRKTFVRKSLSPSVRTFFQSLMSSIIGTSVHSQCICSLAMNAS